MINKVSLLGRLGRDPEVRRLNDGTPVTSMRLATSERWKTKEGEKRERTEWHSVVIWNEHLGKIAEKYLKKGDLVYVEGQLQTRKWEKDGQDHYTTEVVLQKFGGELKLMPKASREEGSDEDERPAQGSSKPKSETSGKSGGASFNDIDDDIPF